MRERAPIVLSLRDRLQVGRLKASPVLAGGAACARQVFVVAAMVDVLALLKWTNS
jgi:hypothetical protein